MFSGCSPRYSKQTMPHSRSSRGLKLNDNERGKKKEERKKERKEEVQSSKFKEESPPLEVTKVFMYIQGSHSGPTFCSRREQSTCFFPPDFHPSLHQSLLRSLISLSDVHCGRKIV